MWGFMWALQKFFWYGCWWHVAVEKNKHFVLTCFCIYARYGRASNLLSTMRPSRRCSVTLSIFWASSDSLNDKSKSWCFWRVAIITDFIFYRINGMWLTLHHTEIRSRQSCSVFWICTTLFPVVWSVVSSASIWHSAESDGMCRGRSSV